MIYSVYTFSETTDETAVRLAFVTTNYEYANETAKLLAAGGSLIKIVASVENAIIPNEVLMSVHDKGGWSAPRIRYTHNPASALT